MNTGISNINIEKVINKLVIVVSVGIIAHLVFLLTTNDKNIFQYLGKIKLQYLALIIFLLLVNWVGHATRLIIWTRYLKQQLKFRDTFRIAIYTELGASVTPTIIGGGPIKLGLLIKSGLSMGRAGFLTLLNGLEDLIMYTAAFIIGFIYARDSIFKIFESVIEFLSSNYKYFLLGFLLLFGLYGLFRKISAFKKYSIIPSKYRENWQALKSELSSGWTEMLDSFNQVRKNGLRYFIVSFIVLITQWTCRFSVLVVLLYALDIDFKPFQIYIQQWMVYLTMIFIPTPGATGGAEATFFLIFNGEIPKELLPLVVSTWRFFMYYLMLFLAVFMIQIVKFAPSPTNNR